MTVSFRGDLFDRIKLILETVNGIETVSKRWWSEKPTNHTRRIALIKLDRTVYEAQQGSAPVRNLTINGRLRYLSGALGTGQTGEHEDALLEVIDLIYETFSERPHLNHPTSNEKLRYLVYFRLVEDTGVTGISYEPLIFLGTDFTFEARATVQIGRLS